MKPLFRPNRARSSRRLAALISPALALAALPVRVDAARAPRSSAFATTYTVTTTADNATSPPAGSLRAAITYANSVSGITIDFNIPTTDPGYNAATGVCTISPVAQLPALTKANTTINGYTQPGSSVNTDTTDDNAVIDVVIDGTSAGSNVFGLQLQGSGGTIEGLDISNFTNQAAVMITGSATVSGCFLGTDWTGTNPEGNAYGVMDEGVAASTIGGTTPAARNVISGNLGFGVEIVGVSGCNIQGDLIGTDKSGTIAMGNSTAGIALEDSATDTTIGGTAAAAGNVISGNGTFGILITGSGTTANTIEGNLIGANAGGTGGLSNGYGVATESGSGTNTIGGTATGAGNIISGNLDYGISLATSNNLVEGNFIGTDSTGDIAVPNGAGVLIYNGAQTNTIGGTATGAGNLISGNTQEGVVVEDPASAGTKNNVVEGNTIGPKKDAGQGYLSNGIGVYLTTEAAAGNLIGGAATGTVATGAGNIIAGNSGGVFVGSGGGTTIRGNSIYDNQGSGNNELGIGLGSSTTVLPNTTNGASLSGGYPNDDQNYPVLNPLSESVSESGGTGTLSGSLNCLAGTYTIDVYGSTSASPSGYGEGQTYLGSTTCTITSAGTPVPFTMSLSGLTAGEIISATATNSTGDTSEFSQDVEALSGAIVTTTADNGNNSSPTPNSLRAAIVYANANAGTTIQFNIPTTDPGYNSTTKVFTISPTAALPVVTAPNTTIDGSSEAAFLSQTYSVPDIVVSGTSAGTAATGLELQGALGLVKDLVIDNFSAYGVHIDGIGATGNAIMGCYIGTDVTGKTSQPNATGGVFVELGANNNTIGGTTAAARNVVSGNGAAGIDINNFGGSSTSPTSTNVIEGNYVGVDVSGESALANNGSGVQIDYGSSGNIVGGTTAGAGNVLSGNNSGGGSAGVAISTSCTNNSVWGNLIGTDALGTTAIPNYNGVSIAFGAFDNFIGGNTAAARNVISGNTVNGVETGVAGTTDNQILGNYIGPNISNTGFLPNAVGVSLDTGAGDTNTVGATAAGAGNVIAGNGAGVVVSGTASSGSTGNSIRGNSIYDNQGSNNNGLGIDLGGSYAVLQNHAGGSTSGPNLEQNFPVIASWSIAGGVSTVSGTLNSEPGTYSIDLYADNLPPSPSGYGEGQFYLATATCTIPVGSTSATWTATNVTGATGSQLISATATDSAGNTSEFARNVNSVPPSPIVTTTADNGNTLIPLAGSLREAIDYANANPGATIQFNIPTSDPGYSSGTRAFTISPTSALPVVTAANTTIDGSSEAAFLSQTYSVPDIVVSGTSAGTTSSGLELQAANGLVKDLVVDNFSAYGVRIDGAGATGNAITGCYIGTDVTGKTSQPNTQNGVQVDMGASGTVVGGTTAATRNVISGNTGEGVDLSNFGTGAALPPTQGNFVEGNYIGLDVTGTTALANSGGGVVIEYGASGNIVGGTAAGAGNVISGNTPNAGAGVSLSQNSTGNMVQGNLIGTDAAGTTAIPNYEGIGLVYGASNNTIGGTSAAARNVISGNDQIGVNLVIAGTTNNQILGNYIGPNVNDSGFLPNGVGVAFGTGSTDANTLGTTAAGAGNIIAGNSQGVVVTTGSNGNSIRGNSIYNNPAADNVPAIDLGNTGTPLPNGSGPGGANNDQNYPVLGAVTESGGSATVTGTLTSAAGTYDIDVYGSATANTTGYGDGQTYLGSTTCTITSAGTPVSFSVSVSGVAAGEAISATATDSNGNTSEFAQDVTASTAAAGNIVTTTADNGSNSSPTPNSLRAAIVYANAHAGTTIQFNIPTTDPGYNSTTRVFTISPTVALPAIAQSTIVDGYTQPGAAANTNPIGQADNAILAIDLNGGGAGGNISGLEFTGGSSTVRGLAIGGFGGSGFIGAIDIESGATCSVTGDFLGTDPTGKIAAPNYRGVFLDGASSCTIGGATPAARNVISGNQHFGIDIYNLADNNVVAGNFIGVDATGAAALGNNDGGLLINACTGNTIGGTSAAARNIISGSTGGMGVALGTASASTPCTGNTVEGNYIGTDLTGTARLGNATQGVWVQTLATGNTIGGATAGAGNLISNNQVGVQIDYNSNVVEGNLIGTNAAGTGALANTSLGLEIDDGATGNTIGGLTAGARNVISGNDSIGLSITGSGTSGNTVEGNYIGTDITGSTALGNGFDGLSLTSGASGNTIGGTSAAARNVISGQLPGSGVALSGGSDSNTVEGNYIGTNAAGTAAIPNYYQGVVLYSSANDNTIGGTTAGAGNLISGNFNSDSDGVQIRQSSSGNVVEGNLIGTNAAGTAALGNDRNGVLIDSGSTGNIIGGTTSAARNVIAANLANGVQIDNASSGNIVEGNYIGTDISGTGSLPNAGNGVLVQDGANDNTIGNITTGGNLIANNTGGVVILGSSPGNTIRGNSIYNNQGSSNLNLGIGLGGSVNPLPNTPGGASLVGGFPNNDQNYPVLDPVAASSGAATISGSLDDLAGTYTIDFYSSATANPSGYGEGKTYLGSTTCTVAAGAGARAPGRVAIASGSGSGTFSLFVSGVNVGQVVSATATDAGGDTSEFAQDVTVTSGTGTGTGPVTGSSGSLVTWGYNEFGQLADGTLANRSNPEVIPVTATSVAAGGAHTLAVLADGTVRAWGYNAAGQLGNGTQTNSVAPVEVMLDSGTPLSGVVAVAAGWYHSLALTGSGQVYAWGYNDDGQLGIGSSALTSLYAQPVQLAGGAPLSGASAIAAGNNFSMALVGGQVYTWGDNSYGELGLSNFVGQLAATAVPSLNSVSSIAGGGMHALAVQGGHVYAWGANGSGQLGHGGGNNAVPLQVSGLTGATAVAAGYEHSLALVGGAVYGWGDNSIDQLGAGTNVASMQISPVRVLTGIGTPLGGVMAIAAGAGHSLALLSGGTVDAWGSDYFGSLGDGAALPGGNAPYAQPVPTVVNATAISAGYAHSVVLGGVVTVAPPQPSTVQLSSLSDNIGSSTLLLSFSGALDETTSQNPSNYRVVVNGRIEGVTQAVLQSGQMVVQLGIRVSLRRGERVEVTCSNLKDSHGLAIATVSRTVIIE